MRAAATRDLDDDPTARRPRVWGIGPFDNDAAARWVEALEDAHDLEMIEDVFEEVLEADEDGDAPGATSSIQVVAAAETVAALADNSISGLPEEVRQWCFDNPGLELEEVQAKAVQALGVVLGDSWLREHFEEADQGDEWESTVEELRDRLRA